MKFGIGDPIALCISVVLAAACQPPSRTIEFDGYTLEIPRGWRAEAGVLEEHGVGVLFLVKGHASIGISTFRRDHTLSTDTLMESFQQQRLDKLDDSAVLGRLVSLDFGPSTDCRCEYGAWSEPAVCAAERKRALFNTSEHDLKVCWRQAEAYAALLTTRSPRGENIEDVVEQIVGSMLRQDAG